ncbi:hypothetical protein HHL24_27085 [Paraburkholderia sp. RP-4-7]|jgi:hypothetical protein|uniref:Uncharacterized protein n=1 Tax=Paraburkholderia polaris TaxID=2728848 RepID=A0A848IJX9_9BURK|nr:hypothetical protein [Paraburkholderia polaris]NMM01590.1 hypothetical protein [Paraburkholderia polaris]
MDFEAQVERGIELLALCQKLQSEKDGVDRPDPFAIDKSKTLDQFAMDVDIAITNMASLRKLLPQMLSLTELGRKLAADGKIAVDYGEDYSSAALRFVRAEQGLA